MKRNNENNKKNIFNSKIISLLFSLVIVIVIFTDVLFALTNDRMLYIDNSGKLATSQITSDELLQLKNEVELLKQQQNNMKTQLLESIYPIGSIYISVNSISPATFLGGTWEKLPDGYYLRASDLGDGTQLEEKLPNITGNINLSYAGLPMGNTSGVFTNYNGYGYHFNAVGGTGYLGFGFDASRSNGVYQNNAPVQPKSVKVYMWKRIN